VSSGQGRLGRHIRFRQGGVNTGHVFSSTPRKYGYRVVQGQGLAQGQGVKLHLKQGLRQGHGAKQHLKKQLLSSQFVKKTLSGKIDDKVNVISKPAILKEDLRVMAPSIGKNDFMMNDINEIEKTPLDVINLRVAVQEVSDEPSFSGTFPSRQRIPNMKDQSEEKKPILPAAVPATFPASSEAKNKPPPAPQFPMRIEPSKPSLPLPTASGLPQAIPAVPGKLTKSQSQEPSEDISSKFQPFAAVPLPV